MKKVYRVIIKSVHVVAESKEEAQEIVEDQNPFDLERDNLPEDFSIESVEATDKDPADYEPEPEDEDEDEDE